MVESVQAVLGRSAPLRLGQGGPAHPGPSLPLSNGKSENQGHALPFCRGEVLQAIDMNQVRAHR